VRAHPPLIVKGTWAVTEGKRCSQDVLTSHRTWNETGVEFWLEDLRPRIDTMPVLCGWSALGWQGARNRWDTVAFEALDLRFGDSQVAAEWGVSQHNRRVRIYKITAAGRKQLEREVSSFERMLDGISRVMGPTES
jgi:hypothetical protein